MKLVTTNSGYLEKEDLEYLGGRVPFIKAIKMGGIGSPKIEYLSGIPEIEKVKNFNSDLNLVNLEILNKGIVIRYHKHYSSITVLLTFEEILKIELVRCGHHHNKSCTVEIITSEDLKITLKSIPGFRSQVEAFFKKDCFKGKATLKGL